MHLGPRKYLLAWRTWTSADFVHFICPYVFSWAVAFRSIFSLDDFFISCTNNVKSLPYPLALANHTWCRRCWRSPRGNLRIFLIKRCRHYQTVYFTTSHRSIVFLQSKAICISSRFYILLLFVYPHLVIGASYMAFFLGSVAAIDAFLQSACLERSTASYSARKRKTNFEKVASGSNSLMGWLSSVPRQACYVYRP